MLSHKRNEIESQNQKQLNMTVGKNTCYSLDSEDVTTFEQYFFQSCVFYNLKE